MKVYGVRIFVDDYPAARRFYAEMLGMPVVFEMAEHGVAGFDAGVVLIVEQSAADDKEEAGLIGRFVGVSLQVDDIEATHRELAARGVVFTAPPEKQFWGGVLAHFEDPAGNVLTLLGGDA